MSQVGSISSGVDITPPALMQFPLIAVMIAVLSALLLSPSPSLLLMQRGTHSFFRTEEEGIRFKQTPYKSEGMQRSEFLRRIRQATGILIRRLEDYIHRMRELR